MKKKWSDERIQALRKLAERSTVFKPSGVPYAKLDWDLGISKIDDKTKKELGIKNKKDAISAWTRFQYVAYGYCTRYKKCGNKVKPGEYACDECKRTVIQDKVKATKDYVFSGNAIEMNADLVKSTVNNLSEKEIKKIVSENILATRVAFRKKLLGEKYRKEAKARLSHDESK